MDRKIDESCGTDRAYPSEAKSPMANANLGGAVWGGIGRDIGWAVKQMWNGQAVCRRGWNGRGMFLRIQSPDKNSANTLPYVWMKTADGNRVPWLCSQTDLLATDWELCEV